MAQVFKGNSSTLLSTEDYPQDKFAMLCSSIYAFAWYFLAQVKPRTAKAFITDMCIHLSTAELKQHHRPTLSLANSGTDAIFHVPLAKPFRKIIFYFFLAWERCWFVENTCRSLARSNKWTKFGLQTSLTVPYGRKKCACHVTTHPKMPKKHLTVHRGRGEYIKYET